MKKIIPIALIGFFSYIFLTKSQVYAQTELLNIKAELLPSSLRIWLPIVRKEARDYGIDPALVMAVMQAESGGDPLVVSPMDAIGLMQVTAATGQWLGFTRNELFFPEPNIEAGVKYLEYLHRRYDGDVTLMLAAYNAGPGAVDSYDGIPPYSETMAYVPKVIGIYETYRV